MSSKTYMCRGGLLPLARRCKGTTKINKLTVFKKKKTTLRIFLAFDSPFPYLCGVFAEVSSRARPRRTYIHSPPHAETSETTYIQQSIH